MRYDYCMKKIFIFLTLLAIPSIAAAQTLQAWLSGFAGLLNNIVIPLIFSLAFLFFIWNAFKFFILSGDSGEGREKAKALMLWGIAGLVILLILTGIIAVFTQASGLDGNQNICPDFNPLCRSSGPR